MKETKWICAALTLALILVAFEAAAQDSESESPSLSQTPLVVDDVDDPADEEDASEAPDAETRPAVDREARYYRIRESARRQIQSGQGQVHIYQIAEEMTDDLIADLRDLNDAVVSPMAIRKIGLSPNLSESFGEFVEATVVSGVANSTSKTVKRCVACSALRSRIEDGSWVVSLGVTEQAELRDEANKLGVKTFLDVRFAFFPGANIVAMQVEILRAEDSAVLWSETYRSDATTAAVLRSGDRVLTRAERVKELERKLEQRPTYGHILYVGGTYIPYDSPDGGIFGAAIGYRLYERFGEDLRWLFGVGAEGFANFSQTNGLLGSFVGATMHYQVTEPNLNGIIVRTGPTISGFFAGSEGNSAAIEWGVDGIFQFRLGAGLSLMYFVPVTFAEADLGGFGIKGRVSFNW